MKKIILIVAVVCIAVPPIFAASPNMQEGKWEITIKMEMAGAPFSMPPMVHTQCISKSDLQNNRKTLPSTAKNDKDCEIKDYKASGNTVTWTMQCKDGTTGSGEIVYKGASYSGTMQIETIDKRHGRSKIVQHIDAKRIGDCN